MFSKDSKFDKSLEFAVYINRTEIDRTWTYLLWCCAELSQCTRQVLSTLTQLHSWGLIADSGNCGLWGCHHFSTRLAEVGNTSSTLSFKQDNSAVWVAWMYHQVTLFKQRKKSSKNLTLYEYILLKGSWKCRPGSDTAIAYWMLRL